MVKLIRTHYREDVPIVFLADVGFLDEQFLTLCAQELEVGIILGGKMYTDLTEKIEEMPNDAFHEYRKGGKSCGYTELMDSRKSWTTSWRKIYAKPTHDYDGQIIFEYARPETVIYINIGMCKCTTKSAKLF